MNRWYVVLLMIVSFACSSKRNVPDVSAIRAPVSLQRFEKSFFALDTIKIAESLQELTTEYHGFTQDFLFNILGSSPDAVSRDIPFFIRTYQVMAKDVSAMFPDLNKEVNEVQQGLRLVKHYFPDYRLPEKVITFIGPLNSYGSIITPDGLGVGLQLYLGSNHPLYLTEEGQQLYPRYISRRFDRIYIPVNAIKNVIDDLYPPMYAGKPLVEQMVEAGKRLYLLDQLMPYAADSLKTGYTQKQLEGCLENEKNIWSFFIQNNLLFINDPEMIRDYMNEAPNTPTLGQASPGFIGQFVGGQIVKKWMSQQKDQGNMKMLMETPAKKIFEEAKYKP
jgi:hypothetical protein